MSHRQTTGPYGGAPLVERARALMDRDPASTTHGCADRDFWHYRTRTDFAGGTWQQVMLGFAAIAASATTAPADRAELRADALNALRAWVRSQHADGSVDEWYRNERSYCATAFGLAGATQALLLLEERASSTELEALVPGLERAGNWLSRRWNADVMNQNLAAAVGLWCLACITRRSRWREVAEDRYRRLSLAQHTEGWFAEYAGMDFGYSTLALDLLAASDRWGAEPARPMAVRLSRFLASVLGASGDVPGRIGSRGTSHAFCYGAEHFAPTDESASRLSALLREGHVSGRFTGPARVDDRYFAYFYFPQFALAHLAVGSSPGPRRPVKRDDSLWEGTDPSGCGIAIRRCGRRTLYMSRRLGGAIAVAGGGERLVYHLGYELLDSKNVRYSSAAWSADVLPETGLVGRARFQRVSDVRPLERWMVPFTIFVRLLAIPLFSRWFGAFVKRIAVRPRGLLDATLERSITLNDREIVITDVITMPDPSRIVGLRRAEGIAMHSPSARFEAAWHAPESDLSTACHELQRTGRSVIEIRIRFENQSTTTC